MDRVREDVVQANGVRFATLEAGAGPLLLCLHGFPDNAWSFRSQLPALAGAGYRVVAPFMRGYAPTEIPADGRYQSAVLAHDVIGLIEALGAESACVFGHDWGAIAAYGAAILRPERVEKLMTAALPHGPGLINAFMTNYDQQKRSWYMFFFQHALADAAVAENDFAFLERLWRDWSPGWQYTPDDMETLKRTFRRPGVLQATLGYYRATLDPARQDPDLAELQARLSLEPITVPTLVMHGREDGCIGADLVAGMEGLFPNGLRTALFEGAGHFLHRERPDEVNAALLAFLRGD
jgi:pimeloyl-ACP methyl ester carboxylesterase